MRIERNLSQDGLAALLPKNRHLSWVSRVERGAQNVVVEDLYALAAALQVAPAWLVEGDERRSEFLSRISGMEEHLDERGKRAVVATAEREVEESKKRADLLSEEEMEILRLYRSASPVAQRLTRAGLQADTESRQVEERERQEDQNRPARTA